jgi:hypothetical protein
MRPSSPCALALQHEGNTYEEITQQCYFKCFNAAFAPARCKRRVPANIAVGEIVVVKWWLDGENQRLDVPYDDYYEAKVRKINRKEGTYELVYCDGGQEQGMDTLHRDHIGRLHERIDPETEECWYSTPRQMFTNFYVTKAQMVKFQKEVDEVKGRLRSLAHFIEWLPVRSIGGVGGGGGGGGGGGDGGGCGGGVGGCGGGGCGGGGSNSSGGPSSMPGRGPPL